VSDDVMHSLGRIESKQEAMHCLLKQLHTEHVVLELRVSRLERTKAWLLGVGAAVGAGLSFLFHR
jgi:hypothetical protein